MIDKIKAFLQDKRVMIVESIILVVAAIGLLLGGVSLDSITGLVKTAAGALTAIIAVITFIAAMLGFKKQ